MHKRQGLGNLCYKTLSNALKKEAWEPVTFSCPDPKGTVEPIIGHLKSDHRAARNFLKGQLGDSINFIMAAAGFNYKKLMVKLKEKALWLYFELENTTHPTLYKWNHAILH